MTTILCFKAKKGKQLIVVGDTQHIFEGSTVEESKIKLFNKLLFCGSGYDRIIGDIYLEICKLRAFSNCSKKILELKKIKIEDYQRVQTYGLSSEQVEDCDFFIIDTKKVRGDKIFLREKNQINNIDMIGSSASRIGEVQKKLRGVYDFPYSPLTQQKIIEIYDWIGRHDPYTGHPAVFKLEVFVLEKNKTAKKFSINFKHNIQRFDNYEVRNEITR